ncbi:MAG TPA: hypothetical protein VF989_03690, partial [Polyangiaceae bacterium]
ERERLFVVNSGSTLISEYALNDLGHVRDLQWGASVHAFSDTHFHIRCGVDRLYVVDGQWAPGLWTVENLDGSPTAVDHTEQVSGVGDFVLSADETELYYWYQYGWGAGLAGTAVYRVETGTWSLLDETLIDYQDAFYRDPLDTPILFDESSLLLLAKNRVFDAFNLTKVLFTFTSDGDDVFDGAVQNAYAADFAATVMASKTQVFSLTDYAAVEPVAASGADQLFFDKNGRLYALVVNRGALVYQDIAAP